MTESRIAQFLMAATLCATFVGCRAPGEVAGGGTAPVEAAEAGVRLHFLEIVTPEVDATCGSIEATHGVRFGEPQADLGGARTAGLASGGLISVRAPMNPAEDTVVRPYLLVDDIETALANAAAAGAEIAMPATPLEGRGTFAIYFLGGIEHGLWQL